ncbi:hypothetical protein SmJEL517_g01916 [Synchytrium microbalum]|uniref:GRAM domain-containing protein n=1 Tax=Synchytrium microbalum TaxID=1806994 RepID=A0A507C8E1_9FUNG|nr:uncharacterized protein SmJEL517_g01916 [Synchytrium microbalum]TPX35781.1 hypothetical protein SmJEL517_g01916 [Synchytrium microbalum]
MSINGATLQADNKTPVLIQAEKLFYSQDGIRFEFEGASGGYPGNLASYSSKTGSLYLTNLRMIYVPTPLLETLKTFNVPLENVRDGKFVQPWFDANRYEGMLCDLLFGSLISSSAVIPVPHGGLKERGTMKLTFREGGGFEFSSIFQQLRSRITGEPAQFENLPAYEEPLQGSSSSEPPPPLIDENTSSSPPPPAAAVVSPVVAEAVSPASAMRPPIQPHGIAEGEAPPSYDALSR